MLQKHFCCGRRLSPAGGGFFHAEKFKEINIFSYEASLWPRYWKARKKREVESRKS
jgi:hypothetical protein